DLTRARASRATIYSSRARPLRAQTPLDAAGVQNPAGDLLDRALGGIEPRQAVAREQRLRGAQFVLHLLLRSVAALRAALAADLLQPLGPDGQRIELGAERLQSRRQPAGFQILVGERIVGGEHPVLQRQVQAGRSLADPRYPDQYHIGERVVPTAAVIVGEREVGGVDACGVSGEIGHAVRPPGAMRRARVEFALERTHKRREQIKEQGIRRHHDLAQVVLHQRAEHDRPQALLLGRTVDAPYGFLRLVKARHQWQSHRPKFLSLGLWRSVSAVTPVWSETKNTVRRLTARVYSSRLLR